ncbi:MAG TPA: VOC family protein [Candidatus Limnocylindrales bacterium]|nr:VOC family protein [Candidatus Limnocylindrales bacterium]
MSKPTCTHVALFCRDIEASVAFYARHVGLHEVHRRVDDGTTVVWMGEDARKDVFVIVLLGIPHPAGEGPVAHLGYAVGSRAEVDAAAELGRADGIDVQGPVYAGPIVGYFCMLKDPDGNLVELSHGQSLGPQP